MASVRQDIAALGDTWNPTILWYARAMRVMWRRPINNRLSWRYFAAMHGCDLQPNGWRKYGLYIPSREQLPDQTERDEMWDQCQHGGWYFLPWHRGYVAAFEAAVAQTVQQLNGPADWALPYWNYLDQTNPNAKRIPAAFCEAKLPDGSPNPLAEIARAPTQELTTVLTGPNDIDLEAMTVKIFTGIDGLGGTPTGFDHFGDEGAPGQLELNPHNLVHVMAGGRGGFLSDPDYAAADPLFWLHHCNIDRLWAAWLTQSTNVQENGAQWREGPTTRQFVMPALDGGLQVFLPSETLPGERLDPTYDDLFKGTGVAPPGGAVPAAVDGAPEGNTMPAQLSDKPVGRPQLVGSNQERLVVVDGPVTTQVPMPGSAMPAATSPYRLFAYLENVQGDAPSGSLAVTVGVHGQPDALPTKAVVLFGLKKASTEHGGNGMNVAIDITDQVRALAVRYGAMPDALEVKVEQGGALGVGPITVGKVSILSKTEE